MTTELRELLVSVHGSFSSKCGLALPPGSLLVVATISIFNKLNDMKRNECAAHICAIETYETMSWLTDAQVVAASVSREMWSTHWLWWEKPRSECAASSVSKWMQPGSLCGCTKSCQQNIRHARGQIKTLEVAELRYRRPICYNCREDPNNIKLDIIQDIKTVIAYCLAFNEMSVVSQMWIVTVLPFPG